jgi:hypothetical protein
MTGAGEGAGADRGVVENSTRQALNSSVTASKQASMAGIFIFDYLDADRNSVGILAQRYMTGKTLLLIIGRPASAN